MFFFFCNEDYRNPSMVWDAAAIWELVPLVRDVVKLPVSVSMTSRFSFHSLPLKFQKPSRKFKNPHQREIQEKYLPVVPPESFPYLPVFRRRINNQSMFHWFAARSSKTRMFVKQVPYINIYIYIYIYTYIHIYVYEV